MSSKMVGVAQIADIKCGALLNNRSHIHRITTADAILTKLLKTSGSH